FRVRTPPPRCDARSTDVVPAPRRGGAAVGDRRPVAAALGRPSSGGFSELSRRIDGAGGCGCPAGARGAAVEDGLTDPRSRRRAVKRSGRRAVGGTG